MRDYNAGDKRGAVQALEYAATQGHSLALWKLGRMYAEGDGVQADDLKAFEYFSKLADQNADESPDSPNAGVVASAFVALGTYFLDGIKGTYVTANPTRAHEMFHYAASYFSDPNAQYNLARLYLDGHGVETDPRQAARWFNLAAEKGHHPSQALLGHLLMNGAWRSAPERAGADVADPGPRGGRSGQGQVDLGPLRGGLRVGRRERPPERPRDAGAVHPGATLTKATRRAVILGPFSHRQTERCSSPVILGRAEQDLGIGDKGARSADAQASVDIQIDHYGHVVRGLVPGARFLADRRRPEPVGGLGRAAGGRCGCRCSAGRRRPDSPRT